MFTEQEVAYLKTQRLARLATAGVNGQPDADAVGFDFDGMRFYIGGGNLVNSRKYKNVVGGNAKVSLIIDDLASVNPWRPRGIKIHGTAEIIHRRGYVGDAPYLAITPTISWSWGIGGDDYQGGKFTPHRTVWQKDASE